MIKWNKEKTIPINIDKLWELFSAENIHRIMPNVIEHKVIEKKEGVIGSKYQQKYKEGNREETYIVEDLEYENTETKKHNKIGFTVAKAVEVEAAFTLIKLDENHTRFIYQGQTKGISTKGKVLLKIKGEKAGKKLVEDFMELVDEQAIKQKNGE